MISLAGSRNLEISSGTTQISWRERANSKESDKYSRKFLFFSKNRYTSWVYPSSFFYGTTLYQPSRLWSCESNGVLRSPRIHEKSWLLEWWRFGNVLGWDTFCDASHSSILHEFPRKEDDLRCSYDDWSAQCSRIRFSRSGRCFFR